MTRWHNYLVRFTLVLVCCAATGESSDSSPPSDVPTAHEVKLPESLLDYLGKHMPDFRPVTQADYDPVWFEPDSQANALEGDWFNWSLRADFDGNGKDDYAIILTSNVGDKSHVALVVVRAARKGWRHDILQSYESEIPIRLIIHLDPPGMKKCGNGDDEDAPLKMIRNPSIVRDFLETDAMLRYYWKLGKWREVYIGI